MTARKNLFYNVFDVGDPPGPPKIFLTPEKKIIFSFAGDHDFLFANLVLHEKLGCLQKTRHQYLEK